MGFLDFFTSSNSPPQPPTIESILPPAAADEINKGRLPQINSTSVFLKSGEICHFIEKAIRMKDKVKTSVVRQGGGYSMPGLFSGDRLRLMRSRADIEENTVTEQFRGIVYVTNSRFIFQATKNGFVKPHTSLTAISPFTNAVDLQYGATCYTLIVPDGNLINTLMNLIHSKIT